MLNELSVLVHEMADELDRFPGTFVVSGDQLRDHYRALARRDVAAALADARARYEVQCIRCQVLPLPATEGAL